MDRDMSNAGQWTVSGMDISSKVLWIKIQVFKFWDFQDLNSKKFPFRPIASIACTLNTLLVLGRVC